MVPFRGKRSGDNNGRKDERYKTRGQRQPEVRVASPESRLRILRANGWDENSVDWLTIFQVAKSNRHLWRAIVPLIVSDSEWQFCESLAFPSV